MRMDEMTARRFRDMVAAYGADPARWPEAEREAACEFMAAYPAEVAPWLDEARAIDGLMDMDFSEEPVSERLQYQTVARMVAANDVGGPMPVRSRLPMVWAASAGLVACLAGALAGCRGFGALERARARRLLDLDIADPEPLRTKKNGPMAWMGAVLKSGTSWRHLLYAVLHFPWAVFSFVVALNFWVYGWALLTYPLWFWLFPMYGGGGGLQLYGDEHHRIYLDNPFEITVTALVGLLFTLATPWIVRALTMVDRLLVHGLLGPSTLATRVVELESDRGVVVDTAAADLRRIERDLHDGAQARLVALAMDLGLAKEKLTEDPEAAARMVGAAHGEVKTALQELRDLARGIHPAVLTDRGLDAALSSVASRCTVPVQVEVDLPSRPAAAI